ncbi:MAG TPA: NAD(P)-dependent oxidoreductase [Gaiellales bacterium]
MDERVLVTGGAGYIGTPLSRALLASGRRVRVLDSLLHGQEEIAAGLERDGVEVVRGNLLDRDVRSTALAGVDAVVHLAAIVGDPACALDPELANAVNVEGTRSLVDEADAAGVKRFVFASTCSNYGRMKDPAVAVDESGELAPVSLYAEQKVAIERGLLEREFTSLAPTCMRFATVYGVAPRMRFDLTVNEFTRDLWAERDLAVFGELFWRPYIHARDAGRAVIAVLDAPVETVRGEVFNAGNSDENFRKLDLVEIIRERVQGGNVSYVHRSEDPRDYRVSFEKIRKTLGFETTMTVRSGVGELVDALAAGTYADPFDRRYRNIP